MLHAALEFERLASTYVKGESANPGEEFMASFFGSLPSYVTSMQLELRRLQSMFSQTTTEGTKDPRFDDTINRLGEHFEQCEEIKRLLRRASKFAKPPAETVLQLPDEFREMLRGLLSQARAVATGARATCAAVWKETHSSSTLKALRLDAAQKIARMNRLDISADGQFAEQARQQNAEENMVPVHIPAVLDQLKQTMSVLVADLEHGKFDQPAVPEVSATPTPWEVRFPFSCMD